MPVQRGETTRNGERICYYQWGSGKKYYYECGNETARKQAKARASKQEAAAYSSGYSE